MGLLSYIHRTCLAPRKLKGKCEGKLKNDLKINYFYMVLQTHLSYFITSILKLNNLKLYKFLTDFSYT